MITDAPVNGNSFKARESFDVLAQTNSDAILRLAYSITRKSQRHVRERSGSREEYRLPQLPDNRDGDYAGRLGVRPGRKGPNARSAARQPNVFAGGVRGLRRGRGRESAVASRRVSRHRQWQQ